MGCLSAADCCYQGIDCTMYPTRYVCDNGGCILDGCQDDTECKIYAAQYSLSNPEQYVCHTYESINRSYCIQGCQSTADCCPPESAPCNAYPNHYQCVDGICISFCKTDLECQSWAISINLANAEQYICHTIDY